MKFERDTWNCEGGRMVPVTTNVPEITYVPFPVYDTLRRQLAEAEAKLAERDAEVERQIQLRHATAMDALTNLERAELAESKLALAEQDARRYRRVRECADGFEVISDHFGSGPERIYGIDLDVALDDVMAAAIAAGEGE